jgi:hypothetical protein
MPSTFPSLETKEGVSSLSSLPTGASKPLLAIEFDTYSAKDSDFTGYNGELMVNKHILYSCLHLFLLIRFLVTLQAELQGLRLVFLMRYLLEVTNNPSQFPDLWVLNTDCLNRSNISLLQVHLVI